MKSSQRPKLVGMLETDAPHWSTRVFKIKENEDETHVWFEVISFFKPSIPDLQQAQVGLGYLNLPKPMIKVIQEIRPGVWMSQWPAEIKKEKLK